MDRRWCTTGDVQADLARATGQTPGDLSAVEACLIYGDRPPPPPRVAAADQDAEVQLMFGREAAALRGHSPTRRQAPPDLAGITKMIRMVENYGRNDKTSPPSTNDVIVVSKLNPTAKEFKPGPVHLDSGVNIHINNNTIASEQTKEDDEYKTERDELAAMLKSKIRSEPQGEDSFRFRHEKYVAIANLLKLHSTPPPAPSADTPRAIQLRTPDYFEGRETKTTENSADRRDESNDIPTPADRAVVSNEPATAEPQVEGNDEADAAAVEASICKVSKWLNCESSAPSPSPRPRPALPPHAPYLGPVEYKRKPRAPPPAAPPGAAGAAGARAGPGAYVPGARARELRLQYEQRARDAERARARPSNLWETLEEDLRRKDEQIRARRRGEPPPPSATAEPIVNPHLAGGPPQEG